MKKPVLGWVLLILGVLVGVGAAFGLGWLDTRDTAILRGRQVHAALLLIPGILAGLGLTFVFAGPATTAPETQPFDIATRRVVAILAIVCLIGLAVAGQALGAPPLRAALVVVCGGVTIALAFATIEALAKGETLRFDSHWGGLGGNLSGWRVSGLVVMVALLLTFAGATVSAALWTPQAPEPEAPAGAGKGKAAGKDPKAPAAATTATPAGKAAAGEAAKPETK